MGRREQRASVRHIRKSPHASHPKAVYGRKCRCQRCRNRGHIWPGATYRIDGRNFTDAAVYVGSAGISYECYIASEQSHDNMKLDDEGMRRFHMTVRDRPNGTTKQAPLKETRPYRDDPADAKFPNGCENCERIGQSHRRYCKTCEAKIAPQLAAAGWDAQKINRWFACVDVFDEATT